MTFAGCILGAGYVSGQELWQFFGAFGEYAFLGLALAMLLLIVVGVLILRTVQLSGVKRLDELVIPWNIPWLKGLMGVVAAGSMFGVYVIMVAGAGAVLNQIFGFPPFAGSVLLCILVTLIEFFGVRGMVVVFSTLVPIMVMVAVGIIGAALLNFGITVPGAVVSTNPLLNSWVFSAMTYVSYGLFGSIGVLTTLGSILPDGKSAWRGVILGTIILLLLASGILLSLYSSPDCVRTELPMIALAQRLGSWVAIVYAILLFMGCLVRRRAVQWRCLHTGSKSALLLKEEMYYGR